MTKKQIAQQFVSMHKESNVANWQPLNKSGDSKLEIIYENLVNGVYGEVREEFEGEGQIEISAVDSNTGNSVIFEFDFI